MIPLLFALLLAQDKAVVEGMVLNALTAEPLAKTRVILEDGRTRVAVVSASDGKFRFAEIEVGAYRVEAQRQGFLAAEDEPWLRASSSQQVKDVVIKLMPQGVIAGHVVDEDGDPIPGAGLGYERSITVNGRKKVFESGSMQADGEGYFFIGGLKAGRYRLSASPPERDQLSDNSAPREDFVFTNDAAVLQLAPGAALRNIEIRMRRSAVYRVRGRVSNMPKERPLLYLQSESAGEQSYSARVTGTAFEFQGIAPGRYVISVSPITSTSDRLARWTSLFCRFPVTVSDRNVDNIALELTPGPTIEGRIRMEGGGEFDKPPAPKLEGAMMQPLATPNEDGTFVWENLPPREYMLEYAPPEGAYVKSIRFNHQPLAGITLNLSEGANATLEIVVAPNAAQVSGVVHDAYGDPVPKARVLLWNGSTTRYDNTDASGAMRFSNLAPGEYRIAAWQKIEPAYLEIPEFRDRFDARHITLTEGGHEIVELKLISKSASDAEAAKLQ